MNQDRTKMDNVWPISAVQYEMRTNQQPDQHHDHFHDPSFDYYRHVSNQRDEETEWLKRCNVELQGQVKELINRSNELSEANNRFAHENGELRLQLEKQEDLTTRAREQEAIAVTHLIEANNALVRAKVEHAQRFSQLKTLHKNTEKDLNSTKTILKKESCRVQQLERGLAEAETKALEVNRLRDEREARIIELRNTNSRLNKELEEALESLRKHIEEEKKYEEMYCNLLEASKIMENQHQEQRMETISKLQQEIKEKNDKAANLESLLVAQNESMRLSEQSVNILGIENAVRKTEKMKLETRLAEQNESMRLSEQRANTLAKENAVRKTEKMKLETRLAEQNESMRLSEQVVSDKTRKVAILESRIISLQRDIAGQNETLQSTDDMVKNQVEEINALKADNTDLKRSLASSERTIIEKNKNITSLEAILAEKINSLQSSEKRANNYAQNVEELKSNLKEKSLVVSSLEEKVKTQTEELKNKEKDLRKMEKKERDTKSDLESKLEEQKDMTRNVEKQLNEIKSKLIEANNVLIGVNEKLGNQLTEQKGEKERREHTVLDQPINFATMEQTCGCGATFGSGASMALNFTETRCLKFSVNYGLEVYEIKRSKESEAWRCIFCEFSNLSLLLLRKHAQTCGGNKGQTNKRKREDEIMNEVETEDVSGKEEVKWQSQMCANSWCVRKKTITTEEAYAQHMK